MGTVRGLKQIVSDTPNTESKSAERRLRGFAIHLGLYFLTMIVLVAVNYTNSPDNLWFVWPMVGWGSVFALHAAYAMGLFKGLLGGPE